jgi:WhiB family redox-sensing transcriptional regulator
MRDVPGEWSSQSACQYTDPEVFFPEKGKNANQAKQICRRCPVKGECLEFAVQTCQEHGIWGGLSEPERRELRRSKGITRPSEPQQIVHGTYNGNQLHRRRGEQPCEPCRQAAIVRKAHYRAKKAGIPA